MSWRTLRTRAALGGLGTLLCLGVASRAQTLAGASRVPSGHLAAGDDVVVMVFREKELSARVFVDDRDQVALPRIGIVDVGALTSDMLRDTIRARYAAFLRDPAVDVRALRRVTVNGAVLKPDVYFTDPSMTLRDVIARAGGVTTEGSMKRVSIVRGAVTTKYPNWAETGEGLTELRSGDEVVVGRRNWAALNMGAVVGFAGVITTLFLAYKR